MLSVQLSENYIGIRSGFGVHSKNFVPDIVKVELSGPDRSPFSVLDLPGLLINDHGTNESEVTGTHRLAEQYITRQENIVM